MFDQQNNHPEESIFYTYLDNELSNSEKEEFEDHVNKCPECAKVLTSSKELFSRIEGLPVFELSKNISKDILNTINNQNRVEPILNRITWFQIIITIGLSLVIYSFLPKTIIPYTLTDMTTTVVSNIETVGITISKFISNITFPIQNLNLFTFRILNFSFIDLQSPNVLIILLVCSGMLWLIGNRFLLPYKSQTTIQNGG